MQEFEGKQLANLSYLTEALVAIERVEVGSREEPRFEAARLSLTDAISCFHFSRFALGRALAEYRDIFKQDKVWGRAEMEIARALCCHRRTIPRLIEAPKAASSLTDFQLEALDERGLDPAKKVNSGVVDDILKLPRPTTKEEADDSVDAVVAKRAVTRKTRAVPKLASESLEAFARRLNKIVSGRFESLPPEVRIPALRYCLEMVLAGLKIDVGPLRLFNSLNEVPEPELDSKQ